MSTVPEAMVCAYLGIKVLAVSCITNMATGIQTVRHSHARVLEIANQAGDRMCRWLGDLTAGFTDTREIPYADIPHFPQSTVAGHKGALLEGKLGDTPVLAMEGRFHFYEGYTMKEVCYPF